MHTRSFKFSAILPAFPAAITLACCLGTVAGVRAADFSNASVPSTMDSGSSTYTLDAYTSAFGSVATLYTGDTTSNNAFIIRNGATATSTSTATVGLSIGDDAGSTGNSVLVTGTGSNLTISASSTSRGHVYVGNVGSSNSLTVTDGATVNVNRILAGNLGGGNSITISQGAKVTSNSGGLGAGRSDSNTYGSDNTGLLTGAGSSWTSTGTFSVGGNGSRNSFTVSSGATFTSGGTVLGSGQTVADASFGNHNTLLVTGSGTVMDNSTGRITVGASGANNTFTLSAGATAASQQFSIGAGGNFATGLGSSNQATITGAGTSLTSSSYAYVGSYGSSNSLSILDGAKLTTGTSGGNQASSIIGRGDLISNTGGYGASNTVNISGTGSVWENQAGLTVGEQGSGNLVEIAAGGKMTTAGDVKIGELAGSSNNGIQISGASSTWQSTGAVQIGAAGNTGNHLRVEDQSLAMLGGTFTVSTGNFLQIGSGYLALQGDQQVLLTDLLNSNSIQVGGGNTWSTASGSNLSIAYFAPGADTSAFTGGLYSGLGGYTIVTSAVPEPAAAMMGAAGILLLATRRSRRCR